MTITAVLLVLTLHAQAGTTGQPAEAPRCSEREAFAAEAVTDYLDSWTNVYLFFQQFGRCYDGSVAEGANAKIHHLLSHRWGQVPLLVDLAKRNAEFKKFMWARLDDEDFTQEDFNVLVSRARTECPRGAEEFCKEVARVAAHKAPVPPN